MDYYSLLRRSTQSFLIRNSFCVGIAYALLLLIFTEIFRYLTSMRGIFDYDLAYIVAKIAAYLVSGMLLGYLLSRRSLKSSYKNKPTGRKLYEEHSLVRVLKWSSDKNHMDWGEQSREPKVGDEGRIVDIHDVTHLPVGYTVEGFEDGKAIWLADFYEDEIEIVKE